MTRKLLLFALFLLLSAVGASPAWADGETFWTQEGIKATAFEEGHYNTATKTLDISTPAELALFAYITIETANDPYYEPWHTGFDGWTVNLTADLDMNGHYWKPAVFYDSFRGIFNGNGHTIRNLKVDANLITTDDKNDPARMPRNGFGLFAVVEGTVQDLTINDGLFRLKETAVSTSGNYVGAIAGKLRHGGCLRNCKVINTTVEGVDYVGGLVGLLGSDDTTIPTTIVGCNSAAEVTGSSYVGGLAGEVRGNASVRYSLYTFTSTTLLATPSVHASSSAGGYIIGNNRSTATGENKVEKNYFIDDFTPQNADDHRARSVFYQVSNNGEKDAWLELDFGPSISYTNSGITAYENILYYSDKYYAADGEKVIFGLKIKDSTKGTFINNVRANGNLASKESADKYSFTMTDHYAEVTAALLADNSWDQEEFRKAEFSSIDNTNNIITIKTAAELGLLAYNVNNGVSDYAGWTIKLSNEGDSEFTPEGYLPLSGHGWVPIGTERNPFRGTFDGQGLGLRALIIADSQVDKDYSGLFGYVANATIKGVKIYNSIIQGRDYVGAIAGLLHGSSTVTDCYVDESCSVVASGEFVGGIAGLARQNATVTGNQCAAPVSGVKRVGGILGQVDSTAKVEDNMYTGINDYVAASGAQGNGWVSYIVGNINSNNPKLTRNFSAGERIVTTINDYDNPAYAVSCNSAAVTLTFDDEEKVATYATSGITSYTNSLQCGGKHYFKKGATLNITLATTTGSGDLKNVTASSGTLTKAEGDGKYTLQLNSGDDQTDVVISATVGGTLWTDYAAGSFAIVTEKTIQISTPEQLALLAKNVNNGTSYAGYTIELTADINLKNVTDKTSIEPEWVPIGNYQNRFAGQFNGNGHTISNLTINADNARPYSGLFGSVYAETQDTKSISNVKLASSTINGKSYTGGIAGTLRGYATVENCVVESTVTVNGYSYVGGIVGQTFSNVATVKGCLSEATVTADGNNVGGIVGENNGTVNYSIYNGTSVTGARNVAASIGRIVKFDNKGTYYTNPDYVSQNSYDTRAYKLSSGTDGLTLTMNGEATEFSASGLTYYENGDAVNGFKRDGQLYVGDNETVWINVALQLAEGENDGVKAIKPNGDGTLLKYQGTGYNLTNADGTGTFTLDVNATDYELTAISAADNFEGAGDEDVPYLIRNEQEMLQLALAVNNGTEKYKGKYFRLENNLDYSELNTTRFQPIGNAEYPFEGYFDGNGKTIKGITVNTTTHPGLTHIGIFGHIKYGKVSHLKVSNSTFSGSTDNASSSYVGGIAGVVAGIKTNDIETASAIYDCIADESVIISGACAGGIVAELSTRENYSDEVNVEGCISAAKVYGKNCAGGVIGWINAKAQIRNCLYTRKKATEENDYCVKCDNTYKAYGIGNIRNSEYVNRDIYYTDQTLDKLNDYDWKAHTVTAAEGLTLEFANPSVYYPLTRIQGYTPNGMGYDGSLYISNGQTAQFRLTADGNISGETATAETTESETPISYNVSNSATDNFSVTDGVYTLKTDATGHNYTIAAKVTVEWSGSGTETEPYIIDTVEKMNLLSDRAAAGNTFSGKFFRLDANLDYSSVTATDGKNFTPIKSFSGSFDGNGKTLSGIRINTPEADIAGIFLSLNGGKVRNLTVKNSQITGNYYVGGIAGVISSSIYYSDPAVIENCYVDEDVTVTATYKKNANAGGLLGYFSTGVSYKVIGNVSKATVNAAGSGTDATGGNAGGIAGNKIANTNGDIYDNLYLGTASQITGASTGAIFGKQQSRYGTVNTNFFTDPAFTATQYESLAYPCENVTYTAEPTANHGLVARYEKDALLKYGGKFYSRYQKGDANGDGVVNITDNVAVVEYIHGKTEGYKAFAADANGDGVVNITDAVRVVEIIHGK